MNSIEPLMCFRGVNVYQFRDLCKLKKVIRLTKWLSCTQMELTFLVDEYMRIMKSKDRICYIIHHAGRIALYVDDIASQRV